MNRSRLTSEPICDASIARFHYSFVCPWLFICSASMPACRNRALSALVVMPNARQHADKHGGLPQKLAGPGPGVTTTTSTANIATATSVASKPAAPSAPAAAPKPAVNTASSGPAVSSSGSNTGSVRPGPKVGSLKDRIAAYNKATEEAS
jgi:hypothetical protein